MLNIFKKENIIPDKRVSTKQTQKTFVSKKARKANSKKIITKI